MPAAKKGQDLLNKSPDHLQPEEREDDARLWRAIEALTELRRIDFNRRYEFIKAVADVMPTTWLRMENVEQERQALLKSWWAKAGWILFLGGALVDWLLTSKEHLGQTLMYFGLGIGALIALSNYISEREMYALRNREQDYLYQWLLSGSSSSEYWRLRTFTRDKAKHDDAIVGVHDQGRDVWDKEEELLKQRKFTLWHELRADVYWATTGEFFD